MKIARCYICKRYFKAEQMQTVDVGHTLYIEGFICQDCWAKIESGAGAEKST